MTPQFDFDREFFSMMDDLRLKQPSRWARLVMWRKAIVITVLTMAGLLLSVIVQGPALLLAPIVFIAGTLWLARSWPSGHLRTAMRRAREAAAIRQRARRQPDDWL